MIKEILRRWWQEWNITDWEAEDAYEAEEDDWL